MTRGSVKRPSDPSSTPVLVVLVAAAVVAVGLGLVYILDTGSSSGGPIAPAAGGQANTAGGQDGGGALPAFVLAAPPDVQEAYAFTADRPEVMKWIPCYCGCGDHAGHLSARNCFVKESSTPTNIQFDDHGAGCGMCVSIALETKSMFEEGTALRDIRTYIDDKYGSIGPSTDTPLPPA